MQAKQRKSYSNCQSTNWDPNLALTLTFVAVRLVSLSRQVSGERTSLPELEDSLDDLSGLLYFY